MAVEAVNGRNTVALPRSRDGKPRPSLRNAFTAWHAFPPLEGTPTATLPLSSLLGILSTLGLGVLLGYVYQRTENIAAPWLAHALGGIGLVLIGQMVFLRYVP